MKSHAKSQKRLIFNQPFQTVEKGTRTQAENLYIGNDLCVVLSQIFTKPIYKKRSIVYKTP